MKNLLLYSLLAVTMLIATALRSAEIIPVWHKVNESGGIHDMEFLRGEDQFILLAGGIQIRETLTGELLSSFPLPNLGLFNQIEITPDSNRIVITEGGDRTNKATIELRNISDFSLINRLIIPMDADSIDIHNQPFYYRFRDIVIDPIRPYIYAFITKTNHYSDDIADRTWLKVYNYETMEEVKDLTPVGFEKEQLKCIDVSDDGRYLAALNNGKAYLKVWDLATMEQIRNVQLWDDKLPDNEYWCDSKDIQFSKLNSDVIYYSGNYPWSGVADTVPSPTNGLRKYIISMNNNSYNITPGSNSSTLSGKFIFFDSENRSLVYFSRDMLFYNFQNKTPDYYYKAPNIYVGGKTIYNEIDNFFLGFDGSNICKFLYDRETEVVTNYDEEIIISPNPTGSFVNINLNCTELQINYQISNTDGLLLLQNTISNQNNNLQIDFSPYPNGVYFLTINCNNQPQTYKIIKEG